MRPGKGLFSPSATNPPVETGREALCVGAIPKRPGEIQANSREIISCCTYRFGKVAKNRRGCSVLNSCAVGGVMQPPAAPASTAMRPGREACGSLAPRRLCRRQPHRGLAAEVFRSTGGVSRLLGSTFLLLLCLLMCPQEGVAEVVNCCTGPAAVVDCSSGVDYLGKVCW